MPPIQSIPCILIQLILLGFLDLLIILTNNVTSIVAPLIGLFGGWGLFYAFKNECLKKVIGLI